MNRSGILESDYLYAENEISQNDSTIIPLPFDPENPQHHRPYRAMGRLRRNQNWAEGISPENKWETYWNSPLSTVGYGEPAFAAFYPNCRSVFGMWDAGVHPDSQFVNLEYEILGWHDHSAMDPLMQTELLVDKKAFYEYTGNSIGADEDLSKPWKITLNGIYEMVILAETNDEAKQIRDFCLHHYRDNFQEQLRDSMEWDFNFSEGFPERTLYFSRIEISDGSWNKNQKLKEDARKMQEGVNTEVTLANPRNRGSGRSVGGGVGPIAPTEV